MFQKRKVPKNLRKWEDGENSKDEEAEVQPKDFESAAKRRKATVTRSKFSTKTADDIRAATTHSAAAATVAQNDQKATSSASWDTEQDRDARAILERNEEISRKIVTGELERGVYRGQNAYAAPLNRREGAVAAGKYTGAYGPVRGSNQVRMTMRIDYNPELCKDYKETGYCGFGDTCKFLHDRTDYKSGWQLEKEWEEEQRRKQKKLEKRALKSAGMIAEDEQNEQEDNGSASPCSSDEEEGTLPFACLLCRKKWTRESSPVVTICKHYFCERCAFERYSKSSKCAQCGAPTNGIFNSAENILDRLDDTS